MEERVRGTLESTEPKGKDGQAMKMEWKDRETGDYEIRDCTDLVCKVDVWIEDGPIGAAVGGINRMSGCVVLKAEGAMCGRQRQDTQDGQTMSG